MKNLLINKYEKFKKKIRKLYFNYKAKKINKKEFTIISSNCIGGVLYHEFGFKFNSPTINGYFEAGDYIKFISNLKRYLRFKPKFLYEKEGYPVCSIGDVIFYAVHYKSFDEFFNKWEERKKRVDYKNIFIIMSERDNCSYDDIKKFDKLKYDNKVIFTLKKYNEFSSSFQINYADKNNRDWIVGLTSFKSFFSFRRFYDEFDFIDFFNGNTKYNKK